MSTKIRWTAGFIVVSVAAWWAFFTIRNLSPLAMRSIHVLFFAPWTLCLLKAVELWRGKTIPGFPRWAIPILAAASCELVQFWTPLHDPEIFGITASLAGVTIGVLVSGIEK